MLEDKLDEVKISVIIPCYNTERFLRECLDCFSNQTLEAIEIICVDDGSTDSTYSILQEYVQKDERYRVYTQENQFAGVARNKGMEVARGKYLYICDSDDIFEPMMLEKLYLKSEEDSADICLFGGGDYHMENGLFSYKYGLRHEYLPDKVPFSSADVMQNIFQLHHIATCSKLYSRSFIESHGLKFQALSTAEDVYFNNCAIAVAERITVVDNWLWTYRKGISTSLIGTLHNRPFCIDEAFRAVKEFYLEKQLYTQAAKSFKEIVLGSGVYTLAMMKTKEAWLKCAKFLKEQYIPEFELLECFDFLEPTDHLYKKLLFLVESTNKDLLEFDAKLHSDEPEEIPEWEFLLNENRVKVSVIVPVYNCEDFLDDCLMSVSNQTLRDIEIICVNDGSTDNSMEILNRFAQKDHRVKIISQENKGLSSARNAGLELAIGEYVMFVDGDDLLINVTLEHLYRKAKYNDLDQLFCEGAVIYESRSLFNDKEKMLNYYKYKGKYSFIYQGNELLSQLVRKRDLKVSACMQIFKLNFLKANNIKFEIGMVYEDNIFTHKALINAKRVMVHKEQLYIRRYREESITTLPIRFKNIYGFFQCLRFIESLKGNPLLNKATYNERIKFFTRSISKTWARLEEENQVIPNEMLKRVNELLVNSKLYPIFQEKYTLYMIRSLFLLSEKEGSELAKNEDNYKVWLDLLSRVLQHVDDDVIAEVARKNNLEKHVKDILYGIKNKDGMEKVLCNLKKATMLEQLKTNLKKAEDFPEYMDLLSQNKENYTIIFCSQNNIGRQIPTEYADMMLNLGFETDLHCTRGLNGSPYRPFIAVVAGGKIVVEKLGEEDQENLTHEEGDYFIQSSVKIQGKRCAPALITQQSIDYCVNKRGLNIAVFSQELGFIIDSVCFNFTLKNQKFSRLDLTKILEYKKFRTSFQPEELPELALYRPKYPYGECVVISGGSYGNEEKFAKEHGLFVSKAENAVVLSSSGLQLDKNGNTYWFGGNTFYDGKLIWGSEDVKENDLTATQLREGLGDFELLIINNGRLELSTDYYGMCQWFYYQDNSEKIVASTSYHLLLLTLKSMGIQLSLNINKMSAGMGFFGAIVGSNFSEEMDVENCFVLPIDQRIIIDKQGASFEKTSLHKEIHEPEEYTPEKYGTYLYEVKDELIANMRALLESPRFDNIVINLTGSINSRIIFAAAMNLPDHLTRKIRYNSNQHKKDEFSIASTIASMYGIKGNDSLRKMSSTGVGLSSDGDVLAQSKLSYNLGTYTSNGFLPEYRDEEKVIYTREGNEVNLYRSFFDRLDFSKSDEQILSNFGKVVDVPKSTLAKQRLTSYIRKSIEKIPGETLAYKLLMVFLYYRNRHHFKMKYKPIPYILMSASKKAFRCKSMIIAHEGAEYISKFQIDLMQLLDPLMANIPYSSDKHNEGRFTLMDKLHRKGKPTAKVEFTGKIEKYPEPMIEYVPEEEIALNAMKETAIWYKDKVNLLSALSVFLEYSDEFEELGLPLYEYFAHNHNNTEYQKKHAKYHMEAVRINRILQAYYLIKLVEG